MRAGLPVAFAMAGLLLMPQALAGAQATTGGLAGSVRDGTGRPVASATVTASSASTGRSRSSRSQADGTFRIAQLTPGSYALEVSADGFESRRLPNVLVIIGRSVDVPVVLTPVAVAHTIRPNPWTDVLPGAEIGFDLSSDASRSFAVSLAAGDAVDVTVSGNASVVVRVFDPARTRLAGVERLLAPSRTRILVVARTAGLHRFDVHALGGTEIAVTGRFAVSTARRADARDEAVAATLRRLWWAGQLEAQRTTDALERAANEFDTVASEWKSIGDPDAEASARQRAAAARTALEQSARP